MALDSEAAETFIEVEVSTAEMFAGLAVDAGERESRERHLLNARKAYDVATKFLPRVEFSRDRQKDFQRRLSDVRFKLQDLGENLA